MESRNLLVSVESGNWEVMLPVRVRVRTVHTPGCTVRTTPNGLTWGFNTLPLSY